MPAFRIVGIDPAADVTNAEAFPVQLAFDTPTADFTMTPVFWRKVGTSCTDPAACPSCGSVSLAPSGDALAGNPSFGLSLQNGPTNGLGIFALGFGGPATTPMPILCGAIHPNQPLLSLGFAALTGSASCDGAGTLPCPCRTCPACSAYSAPLKPSCCARPAALA